MAPPGCVVWFFFFFNDTATTEIYTLSLHDALPISCVCFAPDRCVGWRTGAHGMRSEEHTSELQSRLHLVCRLLLEKKNHTQTRETRSHAPPPLPNGCRPPFSH